MISTPLRGFGHRSNPGTTTRLRGFRYTQDPPATIPGGGSSFEQIWKGKKRAEPSVKVRGATIGAHASAVECAVHTVVVSQSESTTQQIQLQMIDPHFKLHPYGNGPHKEALKGEQEVAVAVSYGGSTREFHGVFKPPRITRGGDNLPNYNWPAECNASKLRKKVTLPTVGGDYLTPAPNNRQILSEICSHVGVPSSWQGVPNQRLGGPFHRQNQDAGQLVADVLDLTLHEWRTEGDRIIGYDPEHGGRVWRYDVDLGDCVREHSVQPMDNEAYKKVRVLRPVSTGTLQSTGEQTVESRCLEFGDGYSASFNPPISGATWQYTFRDHRATASNFIWRRGGSIIAVRGVRADQPDPWPTHLKTAPIWEADSVSWTWGAATPDIDMDLTEAEGGIEFRGKPSSTGTIGSDESERGPIDRTTVWHVGEGPDEDAFELPPNILLYDKAAMILLGNRWLRRVGRQQVEHPLRLPLNHMITLGDVIQLQRDRYLGGGGYINLIVIAYQHVISKAIASRQTTVTCVEYL